MRSSRGAPLAVTGGLAESRRRSLHNEAVVGTRALQTVADLESWAREHDDFISLVAHRFLVAGEWPRASELTHALFQAGTGMNVTDVARDMPPPLGRYDVIAKQ